MRLIQRIAKNTFYLAITEVASRLSGFIVVPIAARILGPGDFGLFNFSVSFMAIFAIFYDFGFNIYIIRDVAADRNRSVKYFANALPLRIIIGVLTVLIIICASYFAKYDHKTIYIIALLSISGMINCIASLIDSFFRAYERMEYIGKIRVISSISKVLISVGVLLAGGGLIGFTYAQLFISVIALFLYYFVFLKAGFFKFSIEFDFKFWIKFMKSSLPFALVGASIAFYGNINMVIMRKFLDLEQIGFYSAAYKFMPLMVTIPAIFNSALMPAMANTASQSQETLRRIYSTALRLIFPPALLVSLMAITIAPWIIDLLYGSQYSQAISPFRLIFLTFPIISISSLGGNLIYLKSPKTNLFITGGVMVPFCLISNYLLIPSYGVIGAAVAIVMNEYLGGILGQYFAWKLSDRPNFGYLKSMMFPFTLAIIAILISVISTNPIVPVLMIGSYISSIMIFKIYRKEDYYLIGSMFKSLTLNKDSEISYSK